MTSGLALPVYIIMDVSASTAPVMERINHLLGVLVDTLRKTPTLADIGHLCVISFADEAYVELSLTRIGDIPSAPALSSRGGTAYGPAFALLKARIDDDVREFKAEGFRVYRPIAFFVTDGNPSDVGWKAELSQLAAAENPLRPTMIAIGIGDVDPAPLAAIASSTNLAFISQPDSSQEESLRASFELLVQALVPTIQSVLSASITSRASELARFLPPEGLIQLPEAFA